MKINLDAILTKKNMALDELSGLLDRAITNAYEGGQNLSEETKRTLETCKTELKGASKDKIDKIVTRLQDLSKKLEPEKGIEEEPVKAE